MHPHPFSPLRALTALLLAVGLVATAAGPAAAENGYRYWNYAHLQQDGWAFATEGPADVVPDDGAVEGFRFGTSTPSQGIFPRADLTDVGFAEVCEGTEAPSDRKRVALLVDYGTEDQTGPSPDPRAYCAVVPRQASTLDALNAVGETRVENGLVCGVDGYPASGCGEEVPDADVPADEQPVAFALPAAADAAGQDEAPAESDSAGASADADAGGLLWPLVAVGLILVLLVILVGRAALQRRRREQG